MIRNGFTRNRVGNFFSERMGIEGSISPRVLDPELRGLAMRLRLSLNGDQVFVNNNADFSVSSEQTGTDPALFSVTF